ncbi:hypothetical protein LJR130_006999 [Variovorax sp. LjRoot130]
MELMMGIKERSVIFRYCQVGGCPATQALHRGNEIDLPLFVLVQHRIHGSFALDDSATDCNVDQVFQRERRDTEAAVVGKLDQPFGL